MITEDNKPIVDNVKITDEEKEEFFRCFLGDEPYSEEMSLFDGKFKVRFKTLTLEENNLVLSQIKIDQKAGVAEDTDQYFIMISTYRLALSLTHVNDLPFNANANQKTLVLVDQPELTLTKLKAQIFEKWPTYKLTAVIDAFRSFEQKVIKLTSEVTEPNFWKADK